MKKVVLVVIVLCLAVTLGMMHTFWPGGLPALWERLTAARPVPEPTVPQVEASPGSRPSGADELRAAETAYDSGDFDAALTHYVVARADAEPDTRERAARGLR